MFSGAQVSLYPMTDGFVDVILDAVRAMDPFAEKLRIETDDVSTLMVGPHEALFGAMHALFDSAAATSHHAVLHATVSRGCPGEPDDPICAGPLDAGTFGPLEERQQQAMTEVRQKPASGLRADGQFSLYVPGATIHMDEVYGCIDFLKQAGVFAKSKNFCTKLSGDSSAVFEALHQAFIRFGSPAGHVALDITISANSPSLKK